MLVYIYIHFFFFGGHCIKECDLGTLTILLTRPAWFAAWQTFLPSEPLRLDEVGNFIGRPVRLEDHERDGRERLWNRKGGNCAVFFV